MIVLPNTKTITCAARLLKEAELVAFPTETVYGLGADARNDIAVKKIFAVKGRPANHPLIVHLADQSLLKSWATAIPEEAFKLAQSFWPGPLTLILKRSSLVSEAVTGGQQTVGLRVPSHPVALQLLNAFGAGIAAPSANRFGHISPTTAEHVFADLGEDVSMILDGGACEVGLESTIVDLSQGKARVLRPGGLSLEVLTQVLGYVPELKQKAEIRVSGLLESHYAPKKPAFLVEEIPHEEKYKEKAVGVISVHEAPEGFKGIWLTLTKDAKGYGQALYRALRQLDSSAVETIYIEAVPETAAWLAVRDRLKRATANTKKGIS